MLRGYLPEHHPSHVSAKPKLKFNQYFSWNYPCTIQTDLSDHLGEHGRALSSEPCLLRSFLHTKKLQTLPGPFQAAGCHLHYCIQWFQIDLVPFSVQCLHNMWTLWFWFLHQLEDCPANLKDSACYDPLVQEWELISCCVADSPDFLLCKSCSESNAGSCFAAREYLPGIPSTLCVHSFAWGRS